VTIIRKSDDAIDEVIGRVTDQIGEGGTRYRGMTYEEGVEDALRWVQGNNNDTEWPFGDD
jgi:hypothetical protein